jgi:predicted esterase
MRKMILAFAMATALAGVTQSQADPKLELREAINGAALAYDARDFAAAKTHFHKATELADARLKTESQNGDLRDSRNDWQYNEACCAALLGEGEPAIAILHELLDSGWLDWADRLASDPDFETIRGDNTRWRAVHEKARAAVTAATSGFAEGVIIPPAKPDGAKIPGIVFLHGGGGNIESLRDAMAEVSTRTGAAIIMVRGVIVHERGAFSYYQRDPQLDAARIETWIAKAKAEIPNLDEDELYLSGFSQGGGMTWVLGLQGARHYRGLIPIGGYVQLAVREKVMEQPDRPITAYAFIGAKEEPAIRDVNEQLCAPRGIVNMTTHLERIPEIGHSFPPNAGAKFATAIEWIRKASADGSANGVAAKGK